MRYRDWTTRLSEVIKAALERPFSWGEFDCCLFAADCAVAVCGTDPAESYRGTYKTEAGAKRALKKRHGSLEAAWDACFTRVAPAFIQRGDIAMYEAPGGKAMAVFWANEFWATTDGGVTRVVCGPLAVWRVE
ncbi:hypothetical protein 9F7_6 [uncultured Caudovirales phage]|uniref:DUF6950 domain-containing protein n=2 Tax=root TaxID=1 RepID=A0A2H4IYI8_9CAUD|nr:hypothetical protein 8F2_3 [uncultured Caudovirales phage]ASN67950.1 hypothetical protein 3S4_28 [uncultured Caudovirales phage]ASN68391.1 hypothetical protein 3F6_50 [uncultured Caudovirales phage]ASN68443.1 hypothetical protein 9F7_6 [uncultured Caudovirales phage]ASN68556.1 hypothetical protein 8S7_23 [uncultured Caudovirales phage]